MNNDIRVNSWKDLQEELFRDIWDEKIQRHRSSYVYRGLSTEDYDLKSSLCRLNGPYENLEGHLLRNFKKYAHKKAASGNSIWNWLAVAQHYGLPTRLIDWTYSPYVALHFATANINKYKSDGVIWCVNYIKTNKFLPQQLKKILSEEGSNSFTAEMLDSGCKSLKEFDNLQKEHFLLFLEPPSLNERIINQHALLSVMPNGGSITSEWLKDHPEMFFRIIIPAELKWEIRDKLDQANITERVIFPGLEGLSVWLRRHYSPKKSYLKEDDEMYNLMIPKDPQDKD